MLFVFHFYVYFPVWRQSWSVEDSTLLLRVKNNNLGTRQERFLARTTRPQVGPEPHSGGPLWRSKLLFNFSCFSRFSADNRQKSAKSKFPKLFRIAPRAFWQVLELKKTRFRMKFRNSDRIFRGQISAPDRRAPIN